MINVDKKTLNYNQFKGKKNSENYDKHLTY